jgi:hypothetical protein
MNSVLLAMSRLWKGKAPVMKILLVDDSNFLRVATERALTTAGVELYPTCRQRRFVALNL